MYSVASSVNLHNSKLNRVTSLEHLIKMPKWGNTTCIYMEELGHIKEKKEYTPRLKLRKKNRNLNSNIQYWTSLIWDILLHNIWIYHLLETSQWAHGANTLPYRRRCSSWRRIDVNTASFLRHAPAGITMSNNNGLLHTITITALLSSAPYTEC